MKTFLEVMAKNALKEFRKGNDTAEIAAKLQISEARASRLVWVARCQEKGLPATFLNRAREVKIESKVA